jgi:hypothetical protein
MSAPVVTVPVESFEHEVVEAGLHRLAQPLTAVLWTLEAAPGQPTVVEEQVRRAIGVLRMMRNLLSAMQRYQDPRPEDVRMLLAFVRDDLRQMHAESRVTLVLDGLAASEPFMVPGEAFRSALMFLIQDFLRLGLPSSAAHLTLTQESDASRGQLPVLNIALHSPALSTMDETQILALTRRTLPLEDSSFDFAGGTLPGAALAQATFASVGISLEVEMHPDTLHYRIGLQSQADRAMQADSLSGAVQ